VNPKKPMAFREEAFSQFGYHDVGEDISGLEMGEDSPIIHGVRKRVVLL
jgi:hypothetical protein